ncbi:MAG: ATP-binding cassette domain-containing protein, partial [Treponema sp.]|nr:ATP-binding cassette domain-containing protein [Treponema sp.]
MAGKLLEMRHVNKTFGGVYALKDMDFDLDQGEIHCLVGQNGSGKSTLIKIIAGIIDSDEGSEIFIHGKRRLKAGAKKSMGNGICVIYQDLSLFPSLTVAENIAFYDTIKNKRPFVDWKKIRASAQKALDSIKERLDPEALVADLSIAGRQLVAIARSLALNAQLIIMDEPTSSLTRKEVNVLFSVIKDLRKKGITILFVS